MSIASYGVINSPCTRAISSGAVETSPFYGRVSLHSFSLGWSTLCIPTSRGNDFTDASAEERDKFEGGSVMVWEGNAHGVKS